MNNKYILNFDEIGSRIRTEREKLNLTREKFAELIEFSSFYIGQIERGDRRMSLDTLVRIANSLRVSIDYLLKGQISYIDTTDNPQDFSILEKDEEVYDRESYDELKELLSRCSSNEICLIRDIVKLLIPHLGNK